MIFTKNFFILGLLCVFVSSVEAQLNIDRTDVDRIIGTLSADSMEGRSCFTPGIEKAARFVANEFKSAGVQPLTGHADYYQSFPVYKLTPEKLTAAVNGQDVAKENIFAVTSHESLEWNSSAGVTVHVVGPAENFRQKMSSIQGEESDRLVLIALAHQKSFERYRSFFGKGGIHRTLGEGHSLVAVLADSVKVTSYSVTVKNTVTQQILKNIVGIIPGKREKEKVVFSAHYDHIGIRKPVEGDSIANGADDDASGTTAVITLAKYFNAQKQPERTLVFVAFTAEEIGGFGSRYFSEQFSPAEIVAMFNIEMVGTPSKFGPNTAWITGFEQSTFGTILQKSLLNTGSAMYPDPYPKQNLFYRSDNATLAKLGVPAHSISSSQIDISKTYHTVNDEYDTIDISHLTSIITAIAQSAKTIISGEETPTRVEIADDK